jgi:hypothetical protein
MNMRMNGNAVVLCGGKACCPELLITEVGKVEITDDDGNKVLMDKDQAKLITEAIKQIEEKEE